MMNKRTAKAALLGAAIAFGLAGLSQAAGTTNNWWWQQSGATAGYNGSVTVKGSTGSSVTATSNPTGSAVNSRTTTATQPPVILQAAATHWLDPVSNYSSLPASGNQKGDVRLTLDNNRTFAWNGSAWAATAIDQNGVLAAGKLQVTDTVALNGGCSPNGLVAQDGNGMLLSCQSGSWKAAMSSSISLPSANNPNNACDSDGGKHAFLEQSGSCTSGYWNVYLCKNGAVSEIKVANGKSNKECTGGSGKD